jgi:hypothetical protein
MTMTFRLAKITLVSAVLGFTACSDAPKPVVKADAETGANKEPEGPPKPISAKTAYWEMYKPARAWATDLMPIGMKSQQVDGMPSDGGLAPMWTVAFVSPGKHQVRTYYYSVVTKPPSVFKGVKADSPQPWAGPSADALQFQSSDFKIDSDAAFKTAAEKADTWLKKHPGKTPSMSLGHATRYPAPMWYLLWGDKKDGYVAYLNATDGTLAAK